MSDLVLSGIAVDRGGRPVLRDVDATFGAGRLTAVIGPNGAGKSTLLAVAASLLVPARGSVELGGTPLAAFGRQALARRRSYLPQRAAVEWPIAVERVVALGLTPILPAFGSLPAWTQTKIDDALARFDLLALRRRAATDLSGGELARVMMARATVGDPDALIADEPTAGLDPRHVIDAGRHLRALADGGCGVVLATHDLDLALAFADDVVAMRDGRAAAHGPADRVLDDAVLTALYDVPARVIRDRRGGAIRFLAQAGN